MLRQRLDTLARHCIRVSQILSSAYKFERLHVFCLGDMVDGESIYRGQHHEQQAGVDYGWAQVQGCAALLKGFFGLLRELHCDIELDCVPGNHGRVSWDTDRANNWDMMLYSLLRIELATPGSGISVRTTNRFADIVQVQGHGYLLYHGGGIRSYQSLPFYGIRQRTLKWGYSMPEPFEIAVMGHFHACAEDGFEGKRILLSGTMVSDDAWAVENLGFDGVRRVHFFGSHRDRPMTWRYEIEV